jgi:hypothetical protein
MSVCNLIIIDLTIDSLINSAQSTVNSVHCRQPRLKAERSVQGLTVYWGWLGSQHPMNTMLFAVKVTNGQLSQSAGKAN